MSQFIANLQYLVHFKFSGLFHKPSRIAEGIVMTMPLVFVVIEDNSIIADDLAESIREYAAESVVHVWTAAQASIGSFRDLAGLCAAFVSMQAHDVIAAGLDKAVELQGGTLVLLNAPDRDLPVDVSQWKFVDRPFTSAQIHAVLASMGVTRNGPAS